MDEQKVPENDKQEEELLGDVPKKPSIMKKFPSGISKSSGNFPIIIGSILIVLFGVGTGWLLSGSRASTGKNVPAAVSGGGDAMNTGDESEVGEATEEAHEAEGTMLEGGLDGEGTFRLEREGGPSQTICLTSTVLDLSSFVDKRVMLWGETMSSVQCPWLMDVVKIKEIE
jgi:hypothetical protein